MGIWDRLAARLGYTREDPAARARWIGGALATVVLRQRGLQVAETPSYTESWVGAAGSLNIDLASGLAKARKRSRDLSRNNDYARGYLRKLRTGVLGPAGIALQVRLTKRDGSPNTELNQRIESEYAIWCRRGNCEVSGRYSWRQIERLWLLGLARDGEFLLRKVRGRGPFGFQVQVIPVETLDVDLREDRGATRVRMGVEVNEEGAVVAYWLRQRGLPDFDLWAGSYEVGKHVRVPADEILHCFDPEEVDQLRGCPWMAAGARRLWLARDYEESASVAASNAAKRIGFFVSPNGDAPPGFADTIVSEVLEAAKAAGKVLSPEEVQALTEVATKFTTTVPGQYDTVPQGYDFKPYESQWPHTNHGEFLKECIRGFATGVGMSYVSVGNNLEAVNYSSARVGIVDEREGMKEIQADAIDDLERPVFAEWLRYAMLTRERLAVLSAERLGDYVDAATWQPRRWAGIDPLKEAEARRVNLELKLTSRRRLILESGEDPDEIFEEIEREEERFGRAEASPPALPPDEEDPKPAAKALPIRRVRSEVLNG